jgi:predicted AAA+ superfamily ATPase
MPFEKEIARQYFRTTMIKEIVRFHYTKRTILRQVIQQLILNWNSLFCFSKPTNEIN